MISRFLGIVGFLLFALTSQAAPFLGKVVAVTDGDTLKVLTDSKEQIKIRLAEIDCPERGQPWGKRAKQALAGFAFSKVVSVEPVTIDRYGRTVATVFVDGSNVNKKLVKEGHCWVYRKYVRDNDYFQLEEYARKNNLGLWSLPESKKVAPWEWRKRKRKK